MKLQKISEHLYLFEDTCNVYALTSSRGAAVVVDFGSGDVLEVLAEAGIQWVSDVLMTHHHRDQGQGLAHGSWCFVRRRSPPMAQLEMGTGLP